MGGNLSKMVKFIVHENQYSINKNDVKLKNFVTQIYASGHVSDLFCQFPTKIVTEFEIYRQNVYISRTSMVSDRINKFQLMPINHQDVLTQRGRLPKRNQEEL